MTTSKRGVSFRLSDESRRHLAEISAAMKWSATRAVEEALLVMWRQVISGSSRVDAGSAVEVPDVQPVAVPADPKLRPKFVEEEPERKGSVTSAIDALRRGDVPDASHMTLAKDKWKKR